MKRLTDNSDVPDARLGILPNTDTSSKEKTRLHSTFPRRKESLWWIPEQVCIWSASETLTLLSWRPWGHQDVRRRWWRPSKNWIYSWQLCFLKKLPHFFHSGKLCEDQGYTNHWTSGQKPHLIRNGKRIDCNISNYVPFVVPGLSASSSSPTPSPTSSSSSSQDCVYDVSKYTENPVPERIGSTSEELRRVPLHKPTETENHNKNGGREQVQSDLMHDLPDWLQEFKENLVDERSPSELRETLSLDIETLPVLLMNYQWSREQKWSQVRVSIVSTRTFRRTQIAISAWRRK